MLQIPLLDNLELQVKEQNNQKKVWDIVRKKWVIVTPEEMVRQAWLHYLTKQLHYPIGLISVEKQIQYGSLKKRYDIVVFDPQHQAWMLVECKAPEVNIDHKTLQQLVLYHSQIPCSYWLLSNGIETYCAHFEQLKINWINTLPAFPKNA